jgi:hypothetical protein
MAHQRAVAGDVELEVRVCADGHFILCPVHETVAGVGFGFEFGQLPALVKGVRLDLAALGRLGGDHK